MFDLNSARQAGATDDEIAGFLSQKHGFDIDSALSAGSNATEISEFLSQKESIQTQPVEEALPPQEGLTRDPAQTGLAGAEPILGNISEAFTGAQRQTEETQGLKEFSIDDIPVLPRKKVKGLSKENPTVGDLLKREGARSKSRIGMFSTFDDQVKKQVLFDNFPKLKFREDAKKNIIVDASFYGGGESVLNMPGLSLTDLKTIGFEAVAFSPAARIAKGAKTLVGKAATGGTASAATSAALDVASGQEVSGTKAAVAGAFGAASELVLPVVERAINRSRKVPKDVVVSSRESAKRAEKVTGKTGIEFFEPQGTNIPSDLRKMQVLQDQSAASRIVLEGIEKQDKQVGGAIVDFLDAVSPAKETGTAAKRVTLAADAAIKEAKGVRESASRVFYDKAFKETPNLTNAQRKDLAGIVSSIDQRLKVVPEGNERQALLFVRKRLFSPEKPKKAPKTGISKLITKAGGKAPKPEKTKAKIADKLETLHITQTEIGNAISGKLKISKAQGGGGVQGRAGGVMTELKQEIMDVLRKNSSYNDGLEAFKLASPSVDSLKQGVIGQLSGIKELDLHRVSSIIFAKGTAPEVIEGAKRVIKAKDPEAWNGIVRVKIQSMLDEVSDGIFSPGKVQRKVFGSQGKRDNLKRAMDKDQAANLDWLNEGLGIAQRGRALGSNTVPKGEVLAEQKQAAGKSIFEFMLSPLKAVGDIGRQATKAKFDAKSKAMAEALVSKKWASTMKKLRRFKWGKSTEANEAAAKTFGQLLIKIAFESEF